MDNHRVHHCSFKFVIFLLLITPLLTDCLIPQDSHALIGIQEGDPPKEVTLNDVNGRTVSLSNHLGKKPVILVFWKLMKNKAFLDYSLNELIFLEEYRQKYHEQTGLEIFGIYTPQDDKKVDESEITEVQNLIMVNKITFPILVDRGLIIFREYGVIALPSTIMIDRAKTIKFIYPSFPIAARQIFTEQIMELVGMVSTAKQEDTEKTKGPGSRSDRLYHYSLQMYKRGLLEQAASPLKKSITLNPDHPWAHNLMGLILSKRGNVEESSAEFAKAIELDQNNVPAHFNYGLLLFDNGKFGESAELLKKSVTLDSNMTEAHLILGLLYKQTGNTDLALSEFGTAFEKFEKRDKGAVTEQSKFLMISALYALSDLHAAQGNDKEALNALRKAAEIALGLESGGKTGLLRSRDFMIYE